MTTEPKSVHSFRVHVFPALAQFPLKGFGTIYVDRSTGATYNWDDLNRKYVPLSGADIQYTQSLQVYQLFSEFPDVGNLRDLYAIFSQPNAYQFFEWTGRRYIRV